MRGSGGGSEVPWWEVFCIFGHAMTTAGRYVGVWGMVRTYLEIFLIHLNAGGITEDI